MEGDSLKATDREEEYISALDVKNYALCPRIAYFMRVLHVYEVDTEAMQYGREYHDEAIVAQLIPMLKAVKVLRRLELASERLRVTGRVDYVFVTRHGEYIPAEVKWAEPTSKGQVRRNHKLQLATYALLIEEAFNTTVKRIVVHYARARRTLVVHLTQGLKRETKDIIRKIYEMISSEEEPKVRVKRDVCEGCGYRQYCLRHQPRAMKLPPLPGPGYSLTT
ncbi:MAG: CRISPR-associated protein Cas4 [Candidatus Nezhaarchaeota archaeon]|nr:CRISPR-associated protein Cas4 [Candidatus Nezhaarchaeota archaeon]